VRAADAGVTIALSLADGLTFIGKKRKRGLISYNAGDIAEIQQWRGKIGFLGARELRGVVFWDYCVCLPRI
jgi:hypothetical protein